MQNHSDSSRERYRAPGRPMEMDGAAIPRFTPLTPREDWYWRLNPTVPQKEVTHSLLVPISTKGTESVGGLFHYTVRAKTDLRAPWTLDTALDLDAIVGTEVTVFIDIPGRGTFIPGMPGNTGQGNIGFHVREITGRVSTARFIERNDRVMVYEFVLEPTLKKAAMGQNYRVFQNKTVIDAIRELLADYPVSIDWRVAGPIHGGHYPVRDLQRQHFETDFTCFMRWCERAGLFFWFEHSEGFHRLVIADTMGAFQQHSKAYRTLRYAPGENRVDEECIEWLELDSHWTEGKVTVVDHDPMAPRLRLSNTPLRETDHDPRETAEADQEFYEYGVNVSQPLQGAMGLNGRPLDNDEQARQAAMVRMQSIRCQGMRIRGSGHLRGLRPGYTFELTEHPLATVNQEWLVLSMKLDIECNDQASGTEQAFRCDCEFEAQPAKGCHFRLPIVTPWPVIGAERAIVTGPEGSELWTDAQGRVCIQLVADRAGKYDNDSFIWLWPAQPWQNGRASSVFLPRVGSEVVVEHINGNPDMPYVAGGLGNRDNPPPWDLAKNMWLTGIRTRESGGSGSNHLVFDDTHGKQQVQLATDAAKTGAHFGDIRRVDDDTGLQEPRGLGAEVRTDGFMALRAALGGMFTTFARLLAKGKIKENGEAVALLTAARDIHENVTQLAQQRGAQEPGRDQSDAVKAIKTANDELRGSANLRAGADDFPEFERPHLLLASAAGIQAAATDDLHLSSGRHLAASATGHVSLAAGKSLLVSVLEKIAFYAQETIRLISTGPVHAESRNGTMTLMSQDDMTVTSTQGRVDINAPKGINLRCNNTLVSLRPDGFYVYTNGQHLIHAAGHATADAQGQPVQFPVTPDSPGKFAAHHVLVENQGGFAISNQPYRMTLDDGRVISGVTNELGEMELVTSNATMFGMIELMSQSEPDHVVGLVSTTVYQDASLPPPPNAVAPAQTMQVGNKTVSTAQTGATSTGNVPAFLSCDPMNFGLRTYRFIGNAKADISIGLTRKDVEYPVAKAYTAAVKKTLTALDWKMLRLKSHEDIGRAISAAVKQSLYDALGSGVFGLPASAMPKLVVAVRGNTKQYGFELDGTEAAVFAAYQWVMALSDARINSFFTALDAVDAAPSEVRKEAALRGLDGELKAIAVAIYHEARHCQQTFWMMSLFYTYPKDYTQFPGIAPMFSGVAMESIRMLAERTSFPKDDLAKIGLHRMLVFYYWWFIVVNRERASGYEPWKPIFADADKVQADVAKMRGVTLDQALQMGQRKDPGYHTHYHEEDAYATQDTVTKYWDDPDHADLVNPGTCTRTYRTSLDQIGVLGNG